MTTRTSKAQAIDKAERQARYLKQDFFVVAIRISGPYGRRKCYDYRVFSADELSEMRKDCPNINIFHKAHK